jgi:hypothetical protein
LTNHLTALGLPGSTHGSGVTTADQQPNPNPPAQTAPPVGHQEPLFQLGPKGLPDETLPHIGKFLTVEDLGRLSGSSRSQQRRSRLHSTAQHLYTGHQKLLPMKRAASECFDRLAPGSAPLEASFTAACAPLLGFLRPSQRSRVVAAALAAEPDRKYEVITCMLVGMAHLDEADRSSLREAVCEIDIGAGMQYWDAQRIRDIVAEVTDLASPLTPGQKSDDIFTLSEGLGFLTPLEVTAVIECALALPPAEIGIAIAELCGGLKLLQCPQPADLTKLIGSVAGPVFEDQDLLMAEAIAGLGQVMNAMPPGQRQQIHDLARETNFSCAAMAGIAEGIAQLEGSEAAHHLDRALQFALAITHPFPDGWVYELDIAVAIAGLGRASHHMDAGQRQQLLGAALQCHPTTRAMAIAGLCAGAGAMSNEERAVLLEAVLACPPQTRAVAIAGLGQVVEHLSEEQTAQLMAAAIALTQTDLAAHATDPFFDELLGNPPEIEKISGLAGIATGMQRMLTDISQARHNP